MARNRVLPILSLALAGGAGYYLYTAGGNPKVAEKKLEGDLHKAASKVKDELPSRGVNAEQSAKQFGHEVGAKIDSAVATVDKNLGKAKSEASALAKGLQEDATKKINEFDRKTEDAAAKAKNSASSWFGGK